MGGVNADNDDDFSSILVGELASQDGPDSFRSAGQIGALPRSEVHSSDDRTAAGLDQQAGG